MPAAALPAVVVSAFAAMVAGVPVTIAGVLAMVVVTAVIPAAFSTSVPAATLWAGKHTVWACKMAKSRAPLPAGSDIIATFVLPGVRYCLQTGRQRLTPIP